jgi:hypothetical protein
MDELWSDIRSLRLRADSRDREAKQLSETYREQKLTLCAESRELRNKADHLQQLIYAKSNRGPEQTIQKIARAAQMAKSEFFKPE